MFTLLQGIKKYSFRSKSTPWGSSPQVFTPRGQSFI